MTKQFNDYYGTAMVPNPYLLPKGFQLTIGGGAEAPADTDAPAPAKKPKPTSSGGGNGASTAPASTFSSEAVDVAQYRWLMANKDAYEAGTLSAKDKAAFEKIANKEPVTAELDALLRGEAGNSGGDVGAAAGKGGANSLTVDINDPDPDLQAALAILKKQKDGGTITPEERAAYRALMAKYRSAHFEGG